MLSDQERQKLEALADSQGCEAADIVRGAIHESYERRFGRRAEQSRTLAKTPNVEAR